MCWREIWEVMSRSRGQVIPTPICIPFESQRQLIPNLPNCFQIPIRSGVHPYMPIQVIGTLLKFITKSIQRQNILICECINLPSNTFPSHLQCPRSCTRSLLIPRHPYTYWLQRHLCLFLLIGSIYKQC